MTRHRLFLLFAVAALATTAASAQAGFTPSWSYLSPSLRAQLATQMGGSLFLPARTPLFYRYRAGAAVSHGTLTVPFTNRVRIRQGLWRWTKDTFTWRVSPLHGACNAWATVDKTLQLGGNKVYWSSDGTAWRCVKDRRGRQYVLSASEATNLGDSGLGGVVASGLDVSARASSMNVAIVVTPSTVRPGGKVVVSGVAGGCPAGDSVTLLSHAFSSAHEFAGVPAVYAQVGSAGRFSTTTTIPKSVAAGRYGVTARCGGGNLGVSATVTVR